MNRAEAARELGVPESATPAEAHAAYRRLALRHHPDRGGDPEAFKRATAAHEIMRAPATFDPDIRIVTDAWVDVERAFRTVREKAEAAARAEAERRRQYKQARPLTPAERLKMARAAWDRDGTAGPLDPRLASDDLAERARGMRDRLNQNLKWERAFAAWRDGGLMEAGERPPDPLCREHAERLGRHGHAYREDIVDGGKDGPRRRYLHQSDGPRGGFGSAGTFGSSATFGRGWSWAGTVGGP